MYPEQTANRSEKHLQPGEKPRFEPPGFQTPGKHDDFKRVLANPKTPTPEALEAAGWHKIAGPFGQYHFDELRKVLDGPGRPFKVAKTKLGLTVHQAAGPNGCGAPAQPLHKPWHINENTFDENGNPIQTVEAPDQYFDDEPENTHEAATLEAVRKIIHSLWDGAKDAKDAGSRVAFLAYWLRMGPSQREVSKFTGLSLGAVNAKLNEFSKKIEQVFANDEQGTP